MRNTKGICTTGVVVGLLVAVGAAAPAHAQTCAPVQECGDVDNSGSVSSSDALRVLRKSVGQPQVMSCSCSVEEPPPPTCGEGDLKLSLSPEAPLPAEVAGLYDEAFDCVEAEGGGTTNGVDSSHCFRKADGSSWRLWNSGCGWLLGHAVECSSFFDIARTYSGSCDEELPPEQLEEGALTTDMWQNNFGEPIAGVNSGPCTP